MTIIPKGHCLRAFYKFRWFYHAFVCQVPFISMHNPHIDIETDSLFLGHCGSNNVLTQ